MPVRPPYIPRKQEEFNTWANTFARAVAENPARFTLESDEAAAIEAAVANWNAAFQPVTVKGTRSHSAVAAKNEVLRETLKTLRGYAQQVAHAKGVEADDKVALGINPGTSVRRLIQPPSSWPVLSILKADYVRLTVRYFDSEAVKTAQAKPHGVAFCQICYALRPLASLPAARITNRSELTEHLAATRSPVILDFPHGGGQQCYMSAYWLMRNGGRGPWGPVLSFTVPTSG
jgi:hypothetical protein